MKYCCNCGYKMRDDDLFCEECGNKIDEITKEEPEKLLPSGIQQELKKKSKLPYAFGGVVMAAAALIAVAVGIGNTVKSADDSTVFYIKDKGLYGYQLKNNEVLEMTERATGRSEDIYRTNQSLLNNTQKTEDGRYILYFENYNGITGNLYCKDLKKQNEKNDNSVKVDSDVVSFQTTENKLFYIKSSDSRNLYVYDLKVEEPVKEKLASDVYKFAVSSDEKALIWETQDSKLYHKKLTGDADKIKVDSDVILQYYTDDLNTIYYSKMNSSKRYDAYCYKNLRDKEKIDSNTWIIDSYDDNSCIYYGKQNDEITIFNLVEDDMKDIDKGVEEPDRYDFKKEVTTLWGSTYVTDYEAYEKAMEKYQEKAERDAIRKILKDYTSSSLPVFYSFYCYDGKESKELVKDVYQVLDKGKNTNPVYLAKHIENLEFPTILMSELKSIYDINDILDEYFQVLEETEVIVKPYIMSHMI